jgi:hypothetical protein
MQNDVCVAGRLDQGRPVERVNLDHLRPLRRARRSSGAHQADHDPAGVAERLGRCKSKPARRPEYQDSSLHPSPSSPARWNSRCHSQ